MSSENNTIGIRFILNQKQKKRNIKIGLSYNDMHQKAIQIFSKDLSHNV